MSVRTTLSLLLALSTTACFQSNGRGDAGEAGVGDAEANADAEVGGDAEVRDGGGPPVDAGFCAPLGSTRLCGELCGLECPPSTPYCHTFDGVDVCVNIDGSRTVRGVEDCDVDLRYGQPYCYTGSLCVTSDRSMYTETSWGGTCVSDEYCRWVQDQPDLAHLTCRYTDGLEFQNGPPDHECAEGALPENPFCGGRCGDRCTAYGESPTETRQVACVGRSETRGFGVCTYETTRCAPGVTISDHPFGECRSALQLAGAEDDDIQCVCMMLSPVLLEEYADHGWAVSEQTCLAYQARYPDEVRCVPESAL